MVRSLVTPVLALALAASAAPGAAWELTVCADPAGTPYSSRDLIGFDNRIALILADELGAEARFVWMPDRRGKTARGFLHEGACDVIMGVIDGQPGMLTSHAYYRTGYVFVTRDGGSDVASLYDPAFAELRVGVPGGARRTTPPAVALTRRGHMASLVHFGATRTAMEAETSILDALAEGEIDIAILWGPVAGHLATDPLNVRPVFPEIDVPFLPMFAALTIGVRQHDEALRDAIDHALAARWEEVQAVLTDARVPLLHLPQPALEEVMQ